MYDRETAKTPPWMTSYFKRTEAEAGALFRSIALLAGLQFRHDDKRVPPGWAGWKETYNPITVCENPQGLVGLWTLQLGERSRVLQPPNKAAINPPVVVHHTLRIVPYCEGNTQSIRVNTLVRPLMCIIPGDDKPESLCVARPSILDRHALSNTLQMQARYMTWLTLAHQAVLEGNLAK